jgi:hypothetical protein
MLSQSLSSFLKVFASTPSVWTSIPQILRAEVGKHQTFLEQCGLKVIIDYPHAGNGHTVSEEGEIDIYKSDNFDVKHLESSFGNTVITHIISEDVGHFVRIREAKM